jgi:putative AlgH/UPF0301 family transcriptional regulator
MRRLFALSLFALVAGAQSLPAPGSLLVASPAQRDVDFAHSDSQSVAGLMLARKTSATISKALPGLRGTAASAPVYAGGPVRIGINALVRSSTKISGATPLARDLFLVGDKDAMRKLLTTGKTVRMFVGLCGWTAEQLRGELRRGWWLVRAGDADAAFSDDAAALWRRLSAAP